MVSKSTEAKRIYEREAKGHPAGGGGRFRAMVKAVTHKGARTPKALAAWIGRKKYGKAAFQKMAAIGRRRARKRG